MAVERRKDNKNRVLKEGEYQRTNKTYEYKWRDKRGNRHSVSAPTLEKLREKEVNVIRDVLDGVRTDKYNLTVNDLYNRWIQLKRGLKKNTMSVYKYVYTQFIESDIGQSKITDLKRSDVREFYNRMVDERHIKVQTVESIHTVLHQVLDFAVEDEYLRYNPSDNTLKELRKAHKFETKKRRALTVPEQELFEKFLSEQNKYHKWYPIFVVMMWTGMRVGEVVSLRWCDIDLKDKMINVNHTLAYYKEGDKRIFAINTPKSEAGKRIIPMLPKVKEAFLMEKKYQKEFGLKSKSVVDGFKDFIFITSLGCIHNHVTLNAILAKIIQDCNYEIISKGYQDNTVLLPKFSNHSLRHTFTTRMCEAGVNIKVMQEILGHSNANITMNIYTEATKDLKKSEFINLSNYFGK